MLTTTVAAVNGTADDDSLIDISDNAIDINIVKLKHKNLNNIPVAFVARQETLFGHATATSVATTSTAPAKPDVNDLYGDSASGNNNSNNNLNLSQSSFVFAVAVNDFVTSSSASASVPAAVATSSSAAVMVAAATASTITLPHANMSLVMDIQMQQPAELRLEQQPDIVNHTLSAFEVTLTATATMLTTTNDTADTSEWAHFYESIVSWQGLCLVSVFCVLIVITVIGNTLVILAVLTTRRLKTITNCFVMSLAIADLLVGVFVMPPAVAVHLTGSWQLGWLLCDIWISLDVLLSTASILSLCAISVDRYLAVTQPLTYSRKRRSKRLALIMILIVWALSFSITCPPMLGWYEPGRRDLNECRYNQNMGYVIYSAMGSFFIPMAVMIYVYARISCVVASRHDAMTNINLYNSKKFRRYTSADVDIADDRDFRSVVQQLSARQQRQAAVRTYSNQTIIKELHEVMLSNDEDDQDDISEETIMRGPMLALATANAKNGSFELTRPVTWKPTPSASFISSDGSCNGVTVLAPHRQQPARPYSTSQIDLKSRSFQQQHHRHTNRHHLRSVSHCIMSLKKEHKTTQTLSIVVGGFIICWLPFSINYLVTPFLEPHQVSRSLAYMLTWLGWFNSAINPFIYAFYSVDFRAAFWRLACKPICRHSTRSSTPTVNTMSMRL